jgi:hypothetical protein
MSNETKVAVNITEEVKAIKENFQVILGKLKTCETEDIQAVKIIAYTSECIRKITRLDLMMIELSFMCVQATKGADKRK